MNQNSRKVLRLSTSFEENYACNDAAFGNIQHISFDDAANDTFDSSNQHGHYFHQQRQHHHQQQHQHYPSQPNRDASNLMAPVNSMGPFSANSQQRQSPPPNFHQSRQKDHLDSNDDTQDDDMGSNDDI